MVWIQAFACVAWLNTASLFIYSLWVRCGWPRPWWLRALSPFAFWVFLPTLIAPLPAVLVPSLELWVAVGLGAGLFVAHFDPKLLRRQPRSAPPESVRLRALTLNVYKRNASLDKVTETIRDLAPDLVAFQEIRSVHVDALIDELGDLYPHHILLPGRDAEGVGLMSRHPIADSRVLQATPCSNAIQSITVRIDDRRLSIVNAHPRIPRLRTAVHSGLSLPIDVDTSAREADVRALCAELATLSGEAILLGDLNMTDQDHEYRLIASPWQNAFGRVGQGIGFTYPVDAPFFGVRVPFPLFRIDHIFFKGTLQIVQARTGRIPGSDHRYVLADFILP